jgi:hypothetical protein
LRHVPRSADHDTLVSVIPQEVPATSRVRTSFEALAREIDNWCEAAKLAA